MFKHLFSAKCRTFFNFISVVLLSASLNTFADNQLIPRADFYSSDNAWDAILNSNGTHFVYEAPLKINGKDNKKSKIKPAIWLGDPSAPQEAKPITFGENFKFQYFKWSLNPDILIVFADNDGDERWRLIALNVKTGKQTPLSPGKGERAQLVGFDYINTQQIIIAHNRRDKAINDLYRVDLSSGKEKLIFENLSSYTNFYVGHSGDLLLASRRDPKTDELILEVPESRSAKPRALFTIGFEDNRAFKFLRFSQDQKSFYMLDSTGRDKAALVKVDYKTGKREIIATSELADISTVIFSERIHQPIAYAVDYTKRQWTSLLPEKQKLFERLSNELQGRVDINSVTVDDKKLSIYVSGSRPSYYAQVNLTSGEITKLIDTYPALTKYQFSPKVGFTMKARDGKTQTGTFVSAHGSDKNGDGFPDKPTPLVLMAHGGPWDQSKPGFDTWQQWLANRGYSVLSPNFRASTGLGKAWLNGGNREWGGVIQNDIVDAIDWAIEQGYADKDKIGSIGASFGGYVSLRLLSDMPDKLACGVSTAASPNLISLYESLPEYWQAFKKEYLSISS